MTTIPTVGVVLLNWNGTPDTIRCLRSLEASTYANLRIIVVDNNSRDDSVSILRSHCPPVELIVSEANSGFAGGNNHGLARCRDLGLDYALLLNNDTTVSPEAVERLVRAAECDEHIAISAPAIYYMDNPNRLWYIGARWPAWSPLPRTISRLPRSARVFDVDIVAGAAMLIRCRCFREVGLLDERYFMYYEDVDYCERVRAAGNRICVVPEAKVWHKVSGSTRQDISLQRNLRAKYRMYYYSTRRNRWRRPATVAALLIGDLRQSILDVLRYRKWQVVHARLSGLWEGWLLARHRPKL
jgi:GT2 family glycosyltransferase